MKRFNLSEWAITHQALVLFMILLIGGAGLFSYFKLGRAEDPSFTIKVMNIQVAWPGATATELQKQVVDKIEKKLQELPHLDRVTSYSQPGVAFIQVNLSDTTPPRKVPYLWYLTRKKVADMRGELPTGIIGPNFDDEFGDVYSALYMMKADGMSLAELKTLGEDIRQRLLRVPAVNKVDLIGAQPEKIFIEISHAKLATLGITPQQIFDSVARQNAVAAGGSVDTSADRIHLRVTGAFSGTDAIAAVPVEAGGQVFRLGDIAAVKRGYEDPPAFLVREGGQPALGLGVSMQEGGNILTLGEDLKQAMKAITAELPIGVEITQVADQPHIVDESVAEFLKTFVEALGIVLLVSFLTLGWRTGIVVALSVPLVLAIVFIVMYAGGLDLHRITLGALIIALGLLVDDAIIAIEMMVVKMEQGFSRAQAATFAWTSTAFPMLTGTLVTAAGFLPVGFANSSTGEYAGGIFWVVGLALIASWFVAVLFTPYLGLKLLPDFAKHAAGSHDPDSIYDTRIYRTFRRAIEFCLRWRKTVVAATVLMFVAAIAAFGLVQQQFFPTSTRTELFFEMRLPEGSAIGVTDAAAKKAESLLVGDPDIETYTSYVGQGAPRFWLGLNPVLPNANFAQIVIVTKNLEARDRVKGRLEKALADGFLPEARTRVDRFVFGPPVGYPVQFRVIGPDPLKVRNIAEDVRKVMAENSKLIDPHLDWGEQAKSIQLEVNQDRARAIGLTPQDVAQTLQTLLTGYTVTQYREGIESIDVVARATPDERLDLSRLPSLTISTRNGVAVPLSQIARINYQYEEPILWRRNRDLVLTVLGDIIDGVQAPDVSNEVLPKLQPIKDALPYGYRIETGGAIEESAKANASLAAVFPIMAVVMLAVLMIQLQSFSRLALVFATAPLGIIGATGALLISNRPFGFVALLGMIALAGMIMRNTVILVDQIDHDIAAGHGRHRAIVDATVRRARPVILTALAAILGMIPLAGSLFWGPMAITIMGGLFIATVLTLLVVPALYALWFRVRADEVRAESVHGETGQIFGHEPLPVAAE
ncbi:efflux RND transporter permease subunit [Pseudorhodoplanes sinuspersici]|uniref:Multidrug transporter AcrB n=1 Tax=Pseudorhodoplanes sinuspersici TaxID=1235591 RepID=A0A1W6ZLX0_9HYPH|nr:efflux RND transporter permease subunit [Pseudorhodoplanes sinuspersici]ARP97774.1 multidrug transporter AcrB [Pseudorhodoplanes sinuspersici]RKE68499.1 multidrug efflux pump subunit AcrB [Pseudorhodoplanes sinuspersici]